MSSAVGELGRRIESTPVRVSGAALIFVAIGMVISAGVAFIDGGGGAMALLVSAAVTTGVGGTMMGSAHRIVASGFTACLRLGGVGVARDVGGGSAAVLAQRGDPVE